jgi:hypothetical protein
MPGIVIASLFRNFSFLGHLTLETLSLGFFELGFNLVLEFKGFFLYNKDAVLICLLVTTDRPRLFENIFESFAGQGWQKRKIFLIQINKLKLV